MLSVHGQNSFTPKIELRREGQYEEAEVTEQEHLWDEVESKRSFIINRIGKLAKKFPTRGLIDIPKDAPLSENESALYDLKSVENEVKNNKKIIGDRVSRLNHIVNKDKNNKKSWMNIQRITTKIGNIRTRTNEMRFDQSYQTDIKNENIEQLRDYGNQAREENRESIREAHEKVLEKKLDNFYTRKSESMINHQYILEQRQQRENQKLKKSQEIKYQTTLAKIRYFFQIFQTKI